MGPSNPHQRPSPALSSSGFYVHLARDIELQLSQGVAFHSPPSSAFSSSPLPGGPSPTHTVLSRTGLAEAVGASRQWDAPTVPFDNADKALSETDGFSTVVPNRSKKSSLGRRSASVPPRLDSEPTVKQGGQWPFSTRYQRVYAPQGSDSGLGSSLASAADKKIAPGAQISASALTGSSSANQALPSMAQSALGHVRELIIHPITQAPCFSPFHDLVKDIPRRISTKEIVCLRDIEKTLILLAPAKAATPALYLDFCYASIECIQATVDVLSDDDQTRPVDRRYTNSYFIDLKDQIVEYADQARLYMNHGAGTGVALEVDSYVPSILPPIPDPVNMSQSEEKIQLVGGIAEHGRPAELVRVKADGSAISLATGKPVAMDSPRVQFKRTLRERRMDEKEIRRSMARRKKHASPEELAPRKCREPGCNKEFKRPCDLTKHQKTHSRPWKCPDVKCKYHEFGWPTEKEMERHINDRHSDSPVIYQCYFPPCPYMSKRESNCKQHMEKAHGYQYNRSKTNGKRPSATPSSQAQHTPPLGNESSPSVTPLFSAPTPPQDHDGPPNSMAMFSTGKEPLASHRYNLMGDPGSVELGLVGLGSFNAGIASYQDGTEFFLEEEDIYSAPAQLPPQAQAVEQALGKTVAGGLPLYAGFPLGAAGQQQLEPVTQPQLGQACYAAPVAEPSLKQTDAILFSPPDSVPDEGFDEPQVGMGNADFTLYPANVGVGNEYNMPIFDELPTAGLGFSQVSQLAIFQNTGGWNGMGYGNLSQD